MDNENSSNEAEAPAAPTELQMLKQRAQMMGLTFSNNISLETLRERVRKSQEGEVEEPEVPEVAAVNPLAAGEAPVSDRPKTTQELRMEMLQEQMRLIRCRITNMDPKKANLPGEIFCVGNELIGTVRKFIPFGEVTDDGYHIPFILYQELESRKFLHVRVTKDKETRRPKTETTWAKEFAIEVLDPLTEQELKDLAIAQAAAGSIGSPNTGAI